METSIFATKATDPVVVNHLVTNVDAFVSAEGVIEDKLVAQYMATVDEESQIGYSRFWLILRRAWLESHSPSTLVTVTKAQRAKVEKTFGQNPDWELRNLFGPIVVELRMENELSWGEISVRLGIPESRVREAFRKTEGARKDKGLRIGKGGRFAYDAPELYLEHRAAEGAHIPVDLRRRPAVADLLNAEKVDA
jgi:hypothetical protein